MLHIQDTFQRLLNDTRTRVICYHLRKIPGCCAGMLDIGGFMLYYDHQT